MPAQTNTRGRPPRHSSLANELAFEDLFDRLTIEEEADTTTTAATADDMPRLVAPPKSFHDDADKENPPPMSAPRPQRKSRMSVQKQKEYFSDESDEALSEGEDEEFVPLKNNRLRARTPSIKQGYLTPHRPSGSFNNDAPQTSPTKKKPSVSVRSTPRNSNASEIIRGMATTPGLHKSGRRLPSLFDDDMEGTPSGRSRSSLFDVAALTTPSRRRNNKKSDDDEAEDHLNFLRGFKGIGGGSIRQVSLKQSLAELRKGEECKKKAGEKNKKLGIESAFEDVPNTSIVSSMPDTSSASLLEPEMEVSILPEQPEEEAPTPKARERRKTIEQQLFADVARYSVEPDQSANIPAPSPAATVEIKKEPAEDLVDAPVKIKTEESREPSRLLPSPTPSGSTGSRAFSREFSVGVVIPVMPKAKAAEVKIKKEEQEEEEEEEEEFSELSEEDDDDDDTFVSVQETPESDSAASSERGSVLILSEDEEEEPDFIPAKRRPIPPKTKAPQKTPTSKPRKPSPSIKSEESSRASTPTTTAPPKPKNKRMEKSSSPALDVPDRTAAGLKNFKKIRIQRSQEILSELKEKLKKDLEKFGSLKEINIEWSKSLLKTAGMAKFKSMQPARIVLSEKVVDDEDRLWNTLAHEFCHVLAYHYFEELGHGKSFKRCALIIMKHFPNVSITTCHSYEIEYKFRWNCTNPECPATYGRHGQTIDPKKQACGRCRSKLVQVLPPPGKEKKLTAYQVFVKENLPKAKVEVKKAGLPAGKAMGLVAEWWKEEKAKGTVREDSRELSATPELDRERELSVTVDLTKDDEMDIVTLSD